MFDNYNSLEEQHAKETKKVQLSSLQNEHANLSIRSVNMKRSQKPSTNQPGNLTSARGFFRHYRGHQDQHSTLRRRGREKQSGHTVPQHVLATKSLS